MQNEDEVEDILDSEAKSAGRNMAVPKKKKRRKKKIPALPVLILIGVAAAVLFVMTKAKNVAAAYTQEQAVLRDIQTYHSFDGTIASSDTQYVTPDLTGVKICELLVENGDNVAEGDLIARLDDTSLKEQIAELEATMSSAASKNELSVEQAKKTYNDYKSNMDQGLNSSIQNALSSMDSAMSQLVSAQQAYNNEVELNNSSMSSTIMSNKQSVDSAYNQVESAQLSVDQAQKNLDDAREEGIDTTSFQQQLDSANLNLEHAWDTYNNAVTTYKAAQSNEENSLQKLYDALIQAQTAYLNSVDVYNAAVASSQQTLDSYAMQIDSAEASTDDSVNQIKLENLNRQLGYCEITAPMSGTITGLSAKVGTITTAGTVLCSVTNYDTMEIVIKIGEYDILGVSVGNPVTVHLDALDKDYDGVITYISRDATSSGGVSYFESKVSFDADEDARSGMSAEVRLITNDLKHVLTISQNAVQTADDGTSYVMVYGSDGKTVENRKVYLGASDGTYTQVIEGLDEGDTVLYLPTGNADMMMGMDDNG